MSITPFTASQPEYGSEHLASHAQLLRAIAPMIADRKWQGENEVYVRRTAAISAVLFTADQAAHQAGFVDTLDIDLFDRHDVAGSFHQLMAHLYAAAVADERDPRLWKPLTRKGASVLIDWLGTLAFAGNHSQVEEANVDAAKARIRVSEQATQSVTAEEVPAGRYAVETEVGAINALAFYKVDRPTEGRWAGYVFVKLIVGGDEQRLAKHMSNAVLSKINAVGAETAAARYGHEIGACGFCGITLTNDESRARGIGPICAAKHGW